MKTAREIMEIIDSVRIPDVTNEVDRITEEFAKKAKSGLSEIDVDVKLPEGVDLTNTLYVEYINRVREYLHKLGFYTSCIKYDDYDGHKYIEVSVYKLGWLDRNFKFW